MAKIESKTGAAATPVGAAAPIVPWEVSEKIGLRSFQESLRAAFQDGAAAPISDAEHDVVVDACRNLRAHLHRELKLRPPSDPLIAAFKELRELADRVHENLESRRSFEREIAAGVRRDGSTHEPIDRGFLTLAIQDCTQQLGLQLEKIAAIPAPARPLRAQIFDGLKIALTVAALTSLRGEDVGRSDFLESLPPAASQPDRDAALLAREKPHEHAAIHKTAFVRNVGSRGGAPDGAGANSGGAEEAVVQAAADGRNPTLRANIESGASLGSDACPTKIDFPFFSTVSDHLWLGAPYARDAQGEFQRLDRRVTCRETDVEAQVTRTLRGVRSGDLVTTPTPFGFGAFDVAVALDDGTPVPFTFDSAHGVVQIDAGDGSKSGTLTYKVTEAREEIPLPEPVAVDLIRPTLHERVIEALRVDPARTQEALDAVFQEYFYLSGGDLGQVLLHLSNLPVEEVYGNIGFADCDTAAIVAAGILNEAGIPAGVVVGSAESGGRLHSGHAKVVFADGAGGCRTYETTAGMKGPLHDLKLEPSDRARLNEIAQQIEGAPDAAARVSGYAAFRAAFTEIVDRPEYAKFRGARAPLGSGERTFGTNAAERWQGLEYETRDKLEAALFVGSLFGAIGAAILASRAGLRRFHRNTVDSAREAITTPLQTEAGLPPAQRLGTEHRRYEARLNGEIARHAAQLDERLPGISKEFAECGALDALQRQTALKYFKILDSLGPDNALGLVPLYSVEHLRYVFGVSRALAGYANDPAGVSRAYTLALAAAADPAKLAAQRTAIPERVEKIMQLAGDYVEPHGDRKSSPGRGEPIAGASRQRSFIRTDEIFGLRQIPPGEAAAAEQIDWRASARLDRLVVREFEAPKTMKKDPRPPLHIVCDIKGMSDRDLADVARTLIENGGERQVKSLSVCALGDVVKTYDEKMLARLLGGSHRTAGTAAIIAGILRERVDRHLDRSAVRDWCAYEALTDGAALFFPLRLLEREGEVRVWGNYYFEADSEFASITRAGVKGAPRRPMGR